ncbi:MAG: PRD domain-containing protein, partial [Erysipelotrichaceae bacterium]|nr:PRD domain-containing protein [Erysipelotrichaceae bacterium]
EYIVLDKGIGYGKKPGTVISLTTESRIFVQKKSELKQLEQLLEQIPPEYLEAAELIVEYANALLAEKLNPHIFLALTDHLHFAVERFKKGMLYTNRMYWEIKTFYPREFKIGQYGIRILKGLTGIELPPEEAANIAFHIVNAESPGSEANAAKCSKLIKQVLNIVLYSNSITFDESDLNFSRFVTNVQYFAQRFFSRSMLNSDQSPLIEQMETRYPAAYENAEKIRSFMIQEYKEVIPDEETAYLAIHIQRLLDRRSSR